MNLDHLRNLLASVLASEFPRGGRSVDLAAHVGIGAQRAARLMRDDPRFELLSPGFWRLAPTANPLADDLARVTRERDLLAAEAAQIAQLVGAGGSERLLDAVGRRVVPAVRRVSRRLPPRLRTPYEGGRR